LTRQPSGARTPDTGDAVGTPVMQAHGEAAEARLLTSTPR